MSALIRSWVESANEPNGPFPLNNLPCGIFSTGGDRRHGVAIGNGILDVTRLARQGALPFTDALQGNVWNGFMALGPNAWVELRGALTDGLREGAADRDAWAECLVPLEGAPMHLPFAVAEYTDFYAGRHHAENVGTMFRGPQNALPPNWLHMPVGYNGRASSVVVSGTDVRRPWGQLKGPNDEMPRFAPSERFDFELELGAVVGVPSDGPISVGAAFENIFGYVLLNDWSARDIQSWEYRPLGPFQSKATATTISPWIVTAAALEPFRRHAPRREVELLPHLKDRGPMLYDIDLDVTLAPDGGRPSTIARTNSGQLYYSAAQQLAHHATSGCPMRVGDLLGSGTISGPERPNRGSFLELSWGGRDPVGLNAAEGESRTFLEDGDTVTLSGAARGDGYTIGFGECAGKVLPALADPFAT